jgi:hypothetical protein
MDNKPEYDSEQDIKQEEIVLPEPSLELPIDDNTLVAVLTQKISKSESFYKDKLKLDKRRTENQDFWLGKQLDTSKFDEWQVPTVDNMIWQNTETRIAIASGRMPDIVVTPTDNEAKSKEAAKTLQNGLKLKITSESTKRMVKDGLRQQHINFTAAIKCRWNKNIGESGDYEFYLCNPLAIGIDHTATIPHEGFTADNAEIIYEWIEEPVSVVLSKFPNKKEELFKLLNIKQGTPRQMMTKMRYLEVWFTWYDETGQQLEGVCWKYNNLILDKQKNPYFDWKGIQKAIEGEDGAPMLQEYFNNFFDRPRKPYIIFSHTNLGKCPIDDTTPIEQSIPLQKSANKRLRQITEIADNAVPKKAFAGDYITKEDARRVTNDPEENIWFDGANDVSKAVTTLRSDPPSPLLYQDLVGTRQQIDSKFATHSVTRGELQTQESGVSKQITREGDLTISDDIVSIVVERVVSEMANWATQMMKMFYVDAHWVKDMGQDGELVAVALQQDLIEDGMAVSVSSSSTDKASKKDMAIALVGQKANDPLSLFEDLEVPNPKERARRMITFNMGGQDGFARYAKETGLDISGGGIVSPEGTGGAESGVIPPEGGQTPPIAGEQPPLPGMTGAEQPPTGGEAPPLYGDAQQAQQDIQTIISGQDVQLPGLPSPEYAQAIGEFVQSPAFDQLTPEQQQALHQFIIKIKDLIDGVSNQPTDSGVASQEVSPAEPTGAVVA